MALQEMKKLTPEQRKQEFTKYVTEIASHQRNQCADRVIAMQKHWVRSDMYLIGCCSATIAGSFAGLYLWGPRHILNHRIYLVRPVGPAISLGIALYCMFYTLRLSMMKLRFWNLVEDYEYELKKANAHHVEEGITHLAWLEFVLEQVKSDKFMWLDAEALRQGPKHGE
jgi:hypothetical protein